MTTTLYNHVQLDDQGVAWIAGTSTKVVELVVERLAYEWDAEQLHAQHPHLTRAQIHSALAFYYDHQQSLDREIEQRLARADEIIAATMNPTLRLKLTSQKAQP